jgi:GNAT superfamily N-acetyltransferase
LLGRYHFGRRLCEGTHRFRLKDGRRSDEVAAMVWFDTDTGGFTFGALAVMPEHRRRGIASAIMAVSCAAADLWRIHLWIHVLPFDVDEKTGHLHVGYPTDGSPPLDRDGLTRFYGGFGFAQSGRYRAFLNRPPTPLDRVSLEPGLTQWN